VQPHHPYHASETNEAKWSPHRISKPDKIVQSQTVMSLVFIENPNLTHYPARWQKPLQRAIRLQGMTGTVKAPSAHDQTTDQAGNNQAIIHGYLYDPNKPQQGTGPLRVGWEVGGFVTRGPATWAPQKCFPGPHCGSRRPWQGTISNQHS